MKKTKINGMLSLLLFVIPIWSDAQTMALQAIGSSGGATVSGGNSLAWTLGEVVVAASEQGDIYLGSGFQQAKKRKISVGATDAFIPSLKFNAYPNPAGETLTVEADAAELDLRVCNILGQEVLENYHLNGTGQLDFHPLPAGIYLLQAFDKNGRLAATVKIYHTEEQ